MTIAEHLSGSTGTSDPSETPDLPRDLKRTRQKQTTGWISLAAALGLIFGGLIAVSLSVMLYLTVSANFKNTFSLLNDQAVTTIQLIKKSLDADLLRAEDTVTYIATLYREGQFSINDNYRLKTLLSGASAANPTVGALLIYQPKTRSRFGVYRVGDNEFGVLPPMAEESASVVREFSSFTPTNRATWGSLVTVEGRVYANVRHALVQDGKVDGYVVAAIPLLLLSEILVDIAKDIEGTPFILDSRDRVLAHPEMNEDTMRFDDRNMAVNLNQFPDDVLREFPNRSDAGDFRSAAMEGVEVRGIGFNDRSVDDHVIITAMEYRYGPSPWRLGVYFKAGSVAGELGRVFMTTVTALIFIVVAVIIAIVLGKKIARPASIITQVGQKITRLELDGIEPIPSSSIVEFARGANAINTMITALRAFSTYVPRSLVRHIVEGGMASLDATDEKELTIMFTDIAGFTTLSETMSTSEAASFLNQHFTMLGEPVEDSGGTIDKYMGDGLLAFWGAPDPIGNHCEAACRAALSMASAIKAFNEGVQEQSNIQVRVRIGIHTGKTIVGNIGAPTRINYTVVGDTVNTCQRLQDYGRDVAPDAETVILLSAETAKELGPEFIYSEIGEVRLRGREALTKVYRLDGIES